MDQVLTECQDLLVRRWGEMGGYWGISRTMAEIHALLFVCGQPLCTDDVMARLHISRGNASMNLRALVDWGLVRRVHKLGDRRDYFQADTDIWRMFETIMRERRRREVEPIIESIERCRGLLRQSATTGSQPEAAALLRRLDELHEFLSTMGTLFDLVVRFGPGGTRALCRLVSEGGTSENAAVSAPSEDGRRPAGSVRKARKTGR